MFSGHLEVLPAPAEISECWVLPSLFPEGVPFVAPKAAVTIDEATVGVGCLHFKGKRKAGRRRELEGGREGRESSNKLLRSFRWDEVKYLERKTSGYHWGFKVRHDWGAPGGSHHRVNGVLLLRAVHLRHEDWRAVLSRLLCALIVHAGVHVAEAIFTKECIYSFNSSLKKKEIMRNKVNATARQKGSNYATHHYSFPTFSLFQFSTR